MKKVLVDTNVVLDIMLKRQNFKKSKTVFDFAEKKFIAGYISASAVTDIFYLSAKDLGKKNAKEELKKILEVFKPATVTDSHIYQALDMDWSDFEDSVQYVVGKSFAAEYIITRNIQDYTSGSIPAVSPEQFIEAITVIEE